MITEATPAEYSVAAEIHAVMQAAYALEAERIGCAEFPPLRESLEELRQSSDRFLMFQESGNIIGGISYHRRADSVAITRLVVSPEHFREGIASALLSELSAESEYFLSPEQLSQITRSRHTISTVEDCLESHVRRHQ